MKTPRRFLCMLATATIALAASAVAAAEGDRIRMLEDNVVEIEVKDCVKAAAQAASDEDLETFIGCFSKGKQPRLRRRAAILFTTHVVDLELLDSHLLAESDARAEVAVKYRTTLSEDCYDVVSVIGLVKEEAHWKINREKVELTTARGRRESSSSSSGEVFRFGGGGDVMLNPADDGLPADIGRRPGGGCVNGRCGL